MLEKMNSIFRKFLIVVVSLAVACTSSGYSTDTETKVDVTNSVVILMGKGYDTRDEIIAAFDRQVEENIKKNKVVVSIGCSVLHHDDEQLHDIFERADHIMYERKKELKSMGARTREFDETKP